MARAILKRTKVLVMDEVCGPLVGIDGDYLNHLTHNRQLQGKETAVVRTKRALIKI
jgi:hypothetical protein